MKNGRLCKLCAFSGGCDAPQRISYIRFALSSGTKRPYEWEISQRQLRRGGYYPPAKLAASDIASCFALRSDIRLRRAILPFGQFN